MITSFMRNTEAHADGGIGRARQLLSSAVGDYSSTLFDPSCSFERPRCGEEEEVGGRAQGNGSSSRDEGPSGSCGAVTADSQMLAVAQEKIAPMLRPTVDAPAADVFMPIDFTVQKASVRRVIQNRVRERAADEVALSAV